MKELSLFSQKVIAVIKKIPKGKVATYGQVAILADSPRAIRRVVWILHACSGKYKLPWHRVLNSKGKIAFEVNSSHYKKQKKLLQNEGVKFLENETIEMKKFQWKNC